MKFRDLTAAVSILFGAGLSTVLPQPVRTAESHVPPSIPVSVQSPEPEAAGESLVDRMRIQAEEMVIPELPPIQTGPEAIPPQLTRSVQILAPMKSQPAPVQPPTIPSHPVAEKKPAPVRPTAAKPATMAGTIPTAVKSAPKIPEVSDSISIPAAPSPVVSVPLSLEVPVVTPAPSSQSGLVARIAEVSSFKQALLDLTERSGGSIAFHGEDIEIHISEDRKPVLRAELRRLIFTYLAETGPEIRISLETRP